MAPTSVQPVIFTGDSVTVPLIGVLTSVKRPSTPVGTLIVTLPVIDCADGNGGTGTGGLGGGDGGDGGIGAAPAVVGFLSHASNVTASIEGMSMIPIPLHVKSRYPLLFGSVPAGTAGAWCLGAGA